MLQKMHVKHMNAPKTPTQLPRCGGNTTKTTTKNTSTSAGTINGCSPHPTHTCLGVGVGVGVGHFIFTVIFVHVVRIQ